MDLLTSHGKISPLSAPLQALRARGAEEFRTLGLPTRKLEDWKYTSVKSLLDQTFVSSLEKETRPSHDTLKAFSSRLPEEFYHLVFINGLLDRTLSQWEELSLKLKLSSDPKDFAPGTTETKHAFEALNHAYLGQGIAIELAAETSLEKPLMLHFHTSLEGGSSLLVNPRVKITTGARSSLNVIEVCTGEKDANYLHNASSEIHVGAAAKFVRLRLQDQSLKAMDVSRVQIFPGEQADVLNLSIEIGAAISREDLDCDLKFPHSSNRIYGINALSGTQHCDHATRIDHQVGNCNVKQVYKSLLDDESRSVFNGMIRVRKNAQKAQTEQLNQNLLLSNKAEADSKPQLMIEADDVKAAHGATVGQLNAEELFYLMSRGLSREKALPLLSYAFLAGVIDEIENEEVKNWVRSRVQESFLRVTKGALA